MKFFFFPHHTCESTCDTMSSSSANAFTFGGWCYYAFTVTIFYVFPSCWKLSRFRPNPTWCILHRSLKTIWGNFQTAASDSYFWKKRNDWASYKTMTTNLNKNHMIYPTLFHAVDTQCLVAVFLPLMCFLPVFFAGDSQFYEEDTLLSTELFRLK